MTRLLQLSSPSFFSSDKPVSPSKIFFYSRKPEQYNCHNHTNNHKYREWHLVNGYLRAEGFSFSFKRGWCQGCSLQASDETRDFSCSRAQAPARPGGAPKHPKAPARLLLPLATNRRSPACTD